MSSMGMCLCLCMDMCLSVSVSVWVCVCVCVFVCSGGLWNGETAAAESSSTAGLFLALGVE